MTTRRKTVSPKMFLYVYRNQIYQSQLDRILADSGKIPASIGAVLTDSNRNIISIFYGELDLDRQMCSTKEKIPGTLYQNKQIFYHRIRRQEYDETKFGYSVNMKNHMWTTIRVMFARWLADNYEEYTLERKKKHLSSKGIEVVVYQYEDNFPISDIYFGSAMYDNLLDEIDRGWISKLDAIPLEIDGYHRANVIAHDVYYDEDQINKDKEVVRKNPAFAEFFKYPTKKLAGNAAVAALNFKINDDNMEIVW